MKNINPDIHISTVMPGMVFTDFSKNAIGGPPSAFTPLSGAKPQTAAEAVSAIVAVVEKPQAEIYTNPALAELANQYNFDVAAFENNMPGKSL